MQSCFVRAKRRAKWICQSFMPRLGPPLVDRIYKSRLSLAFLFLNSSSHRLCSPKKVMPTWDVSALLCPERSGKGPMSNVSALAQRMISESLPPKLPEDKFSLPSIFHYHLRHNIKIEPSPGHVVLRAEPCRISKNLDALPMFCLSNKST